MNPKELSREEKRSEAKVLADSILEIYRKYEPQLYKSMKMKKTQKIDVKKIHSLLKGLNETEFIYVTHLIDTASTLKRMIRKYKLDKKRFCDLFKIKPNQYQNFISGAYNYSLMKLAIINAVYYELEAEHIAKNPLLQIGIETRKY